MLFMIRRYFYINRLIMSSESELVRREAGFQIITLDDGRKCAAVVKASTDKKTTKSKKNNNVLKLVFATKSYISEEHLPNGVIFLPDNEIIKEQEKLDKYKELKEKEYEEQRQQEYIKLNENSRNDFENLKDLTNSQINTQISQIQEIKNVIKIERLRKEKNKNESLEENNLQNNTLITQFKKFSIDTEGSSSTLYDLNKIKDNGHINTENNIGVFHIIKNNQTYKVLFSSEDLNLINAFKWFIDSYGYPASNYNYYKGTQLPLRMHEIISGWTNRDEDLSEYVIDHINNNRLDHRRCNLRRTTKQVNSLNCEKYNTETSTSKYKNVYMDYERYYISVRCPIRGALCIKDYPYNNSPLKETISIRTAFIGEGRTLPGSYYNEDEAACMANANMVALWGLDACINKIIGGQEQKIEIHYAIALAYYNVNNKLIRKIIPPIKFGITLSELYSKFDLHLTKSKIIHKDNIENSVLIWREHYANNYDEIISILDNYEFELIKQNEQDKIINIYEDKEDEAISAYTSNDDIYIYSKSCEYLIKGKCWRKSQSGYFRTLINGKTILMHRLVLGLNSSESEDEDINNSKLIVDHINKRKNDNRISNLRITDYTTNSQNTDKLSRVDIESMSSKYKGVSYEQTSGLFVVNISYHNIKIHIGKFGNEKLAAYAYNFMIAELNN